MIALAHRRATQLDAPLIAAVPWCACAGKRDPCFNRTQEEPRAVGGFPFAAFGATEGHCQSGFMLAAFTTFAALSTSPLMNAENSSGLLATTITPAEVSFSTTSGCCRAREISA